MQQVGTQWKIVWPKKIPSILISTALIVAIRTAKAAGYRLYPIFDILPWNLRSLRCSSRSK
jgi:hypothetical protein